VAFFKRRGAESVDLQPVAPDVVPIGGAADRQHIRVAGQVTRMRARPTAGLPALAVSINDGTGTVTAVWTGRRSIGGVTLGRSLVLEGVAVRKGGALEFLNPAYTLLPR
jgi:hypothetical protein